MSEIAKKAREAMKAKAKNLADRPVEKVDSSDWTPPPLLNADVKTGMRPVSRRAFKSGGKVSGDAAPARADRKARKAGGSSEQPIVDRYINRDLKKANEYRDGEKHIGGFKKGGRTKKEDGGSAGSDDIGKMIRQSEIEEGMKGRGLPSRVPTPMARPKPESDYKGPKRDTPKPGLPGYKKGGRAAKADGGMMDPRLGIVRPKTMEFGDNVVTPGLKKGGKAEHPDVAEDKALIKKMVKEKALKDGKCYGGRTKKQTGGGVFTGPGYPSKVPGVVTGGRDAHAKGGRAKGKGKTNINIVIAAGRHQEDQQPKMPPMPPRGAGAPPMPPMPAIGAAGPSMAPPTGAAGISPMPPMARKSGGRITKVAKSYEDMEAGAGSGEGRLQKTDIAKRTMHKDGGKVGHRSYRSYKDMDAGSGSGLGRLEKTEIESHKN